MGYEITIGEMVYDTDGYILAEEVYLSNAPADGVPTDFTNTRMVSYYGWAEFLYNTNIPIQIIIDDHPGFVRVSEVTKSVIDNAYKRIDSLERSSDVARLEWLKFWIDWALTNCKNPIIQNT